MPINTRIFQEPPSQQHTIPSAKHRYSIVLVVLGNANIFMSIMLANECINPDRNSPIDRRTELRAYPAVNSAG